MPYTQFNFKLSLGGRTVLGAFQELSGVGTQRPRKKITKLTGLNKSTDVTLKRGVINAPALNEMLPAVMPALPLPMPMLPLSKATVSSVSAATARLALNPESTEVRLIASIPE